MPALGTLEAEVGLLADKLLVFALREHIDPDDLDDTNRLYAKALSLADADLMFRGFRGTGKTAGQIVRKVIGELRDDRDAQQAARAALLRIKGRQNAEKELEAMLCLVPRLNRLVERLETAGRPLLEQRAAYEACEGW